MTFLLTPGIKGVNLPDDKVLSNFASSNFDCIDEYHMDVRLQFDNLHNLCLVYLLQFRNARKKPLRLLINVYRNLFRLPFLNSGYMSQEIFPLY